MMPPYQPNQKLIRTSKKRGADFSVYHDAANNKYNHSAMTVILLADIRDELHELNAGVRTLLSEMRRQHRSTYRKLHALLNDTRFLVKKPFA